MRSVHVTITLITFLLLQGTEGGQKNLFVSHKGNDTASCKSPSRSCKTLQRAISLSDWNDVIHVDAAGGAYLVEQPEDQYINITHTLTIQSDRDRAKISCGNGSTLFHVFSADTTSQHSAVRKKHSTVTLNINSIHILKCNQTWTDPSVIRITNANIKIKNSEFGSNGVLFGHPPLSKQCQYANLAIFNSSFTDNGIIEPYKPTVSIFGCDTLRVNIHDTLLKWSPMKFAANRNLSVEMARVTVDGRTLRSSALDFVLAAEHSIISVTDSIVMNLNNSQESAVTVSTTQTSRLSPTVNMKNVTFKQNTRTKTYGSALSILSKMTQQTVPVNAKLVSCQFVNNSGVSSGGALYLRGVSKVSLVNCNFAHNSAPEGGAVYIGDSSEVVFDHCWFSNNLAHGWETGDYYGKGGAIWGFHSDVSIRYSHFINNSASIYGQAVHLTDMTKGSLINSQITNTRSKLPRPQEEVYLHQSHTDFAAKSKVNFFNNKFEISSGPTTQGGLYRVVSKVVLTCQDNLLCCPRGQRVMNLSLSDYPVRADDSVKSTMYTWCEACPVGQYSLQKTCVSSSQLENTLAVEGGLLCQPCPQHAQCLGDGDIRPVNNYWGQTSNESMSFHLCPYGYCNNISCSDLHCCSNGRVGKLCGRCEADKHYDMSVEECVPTKQCRFLFVFLAGYAVAFAFFYTCVICLFSLLKQSRSKKGLEDTADQPTTSVTEGQHSGDLDTTSDSFEPSIEYTGSVDSHGLVPVHEATQTSQGLGSSSGSTVRAEKTNSFLTDMPFVLCVWFMLLQILEDTYQPWFEHSDWRYTILKVFMDVLNFRPVYVFLPAPCSFGSLASLAKPILSLVCIGGMFATGIILVGLSNIVLAITEKIKHVDMSGQKQTTNALFCRVLMVVLVLTHVPLLKICFTFIHCVGGVDPDVTLLFLNSEITCNQWWHWAVVSVIIVVLAPFGAGLCMGLQLLKSDNIGPLRFLAGLVCPLPTLIYWEIRYGKRLCRCLLPYEYAYARMQLESIRLDSYANKCQLSIIEFFSLPFKKHPETLHQSRSDRGKKETPNNSNGSLIYVFLRVFIVVAFSGLLSNFPVVRGIVLVCCFLIMAMVQLTWQLYSSPLSNQLEVCMLSILCILSVLGVHNAVIYSAGVQRTGEVLAITRVLDWIYLVTVGLLLMELLVILVVYLVKACRN